MYKLSRSVFCALPTTISTRLILSILLLGSYFSVSAQTRDGKFTVDGLEFKMQIPLKWQVMETKDGICKDDETNLKLNASFECKKCGGNMIVALSEITPEEREKRKNAKDEYDPYELDEVSYAKEIGEYKLASGYYEGKVDNDTFFYTNAQGQFFVKKKVQKNKRLIPIHTYSRWYYFPFNDSLELIIAFNGLISHDDESTVDGAMLEFTENFFKVNLSSIDTLLDSTDPYRNEPDQWPLDSVAFWNTHLKFPTIDGWWYEYNGARSPERVTHVKANIVTTDPCDEGTITITSEIQPVDPMDNINKEYLRAVKKNLGSDVALKLLEKATDTTGFADQENHCSFDATQSSAERTDCNTTTRHLDSVHVYIYLSAYKRIDVTVAFRMSSTSDVRNAKYYHDFNRFIEEFIEANDFEKVYQLNKE